MARIGTLVIIALTLSLTLSGQNNNEYFKYIPHLNESTPEWASKMYEDDPNVYEVDYLFDQYYQANSFEKTIHTQNYKHWRKLVSQHCDDQGFIRASTLEESRSIAAKIKKQKADQIRTSRSSTDTWTSIGPFQTYRNNSLELQSQHANVYSIDVSSNDQDHILIGTESGGVFHTSDKGLNWTLISKDENFAGGITAVQIDPSDEDRYLVYADQTIYESTDQGQAWSILYTVGARVDEIKFDPQNANIIYLVAQNGLHRTTNNGQTWTVIYSEACWDLDFHPTNDDVVYLLKSNPSDVRSELYKSTNNGFSFSLKDSGWYNPENTAEAIEGGGKIAVSEDDPSRVYVALIGESKVGDNGWIGLYRSDNSGESWSLPSGQIGGPYADMNTMPWSVASYSSGYHQGYYNFDCEASPDDADLLWMGTVRLAESSDGGTSYVSIGGANSTRLDYVHADIQAIEVEGGDVWVASDGGLNLSDDDLNSHEARHNGIIASNFWGFGIGWNEDIYVGGKYHNGNTTYRANYGEGNTHNVGGVEEATGYVNPLLGNHAYFNQYWSGYSIRKVLSEELGGTTSNGAPVYMIPNESYVESSSSALYFHPLYADRMYAGEGNTIQTSLDGGTSWDTLYTFPDAGSVYEIDIARSDPDVMYCVFHSGGGYWDWCEIYKSTDGGQSFNQISNIPGNRWRLEFDIDPYNPDEIWVAGANAGNGEKIYRSTNSGDTWVNMSSSIFDDQKIDDVLYQPGSDGMVYVPTTNGFYYYDPATSAWVDYSDGLPFQVRALQVKPFFAQNKLRLATYGRGVWEAELPSSYTESVEIMTESDSIHCSRDTVMLDSYSILDQSGVTWQWTIDPQPTFIDDATKRNPKIVLGGDGDYDVTLEAISSSGTLSVTEENLITVQSNCEADTIPGLSFLTEGTADYVQLPDMNIEATNTFTVSAWVKPNGIQDEFSSILMNDGDAAGLNFREANNTLAYHWPGGAWWWDSNLEVPADVWSHVALVVDPNSITVYLNGQSATHNTSANPVDLGTMKISSYKGWGSRNYKGEVDEVAVWNRALTEDEIRSHRHLTKEDLIDDDPDFVAYYQFNDSGSQILDRIGNKHGNMTGGSSLITSTTAVGGGISSKSNIDNSGIYTFAEGQVTIDIDAQGSYPQGDVWVSLIHLDPYNAPENVENVGSYFVVNNYGDQGFTSGVTYTYDDPLSSPLSSSTESPQTIYLMSRADNNDEFSWETDCNQTTIDGEVYTIVECSDTGIDKQYRIFKECLEQAIVDEDYPSNTSKTLFVNTTIEANNTILSGSDVHFKAGDYILLDQGFTNDAGAVLLIEIGGCDH